MEGFKAGTTYYFTTVLVDIYKNHLISNPAEGTKIEIKARYLNHDDWTSPIGVPDLKQWQQVFGKDIVGIASSNNDGTFSSQITLYRAGSYQLSVQVNGADVTDSPFTTQLKVRPTDLYAPACVMKDVKTEMTAGVPVQFEIQTRDFYSNNKKELMNEILQGP